MGRGPAVDVVDHVLPMGELRVDEPIDERVHLGFDILRGVGHDLGFESLPELCLVEELWQPGNADGVVEELHPPQLHPAERIVDVSEPKIELAPHVGGPSVGLALDVVDGAEIVSQQCEPALDRLERTAEQVGGDAEGITELEPQQLAAVEGVAEEFLHRRQTALGPRRRILGFGRTEGRDRKDLGIHTQEIVRVQRHIGHDLAHLVLGAQNVDLVDHHGDLFAPATDALQKQPFALRQWAVGRGHKEHQVGAWNVVGGEGFVGPVEGVGAGSVDDGELAQGLDRGGDPFTHRAHGFSRERLAPADVVDLRGRRCHPFGKHRLAEESVDERALAGVELADNHQQKKFVELAHRIGQGFQVLGAGLAALQTHRDLIQQLALRLQQLTLLVVEDRIQHGSILARPDGRE